MPSGTVAPRPARLRTAFSFCAAAAMVVPIAGFLAEPALLLRLLQPVGEVGVDLFQPRRLGRVDPK